jgi:hypothetical protein
LNTTQVCGRVNQWINSYIFKYSTKNAFEWWYFHKKRRYIREVMRFSVFVPVLTEIRTCNLPVSVRLLKTSTIHIVAGLRAWKRVAVDWWNHSPHAFIEERTQNRHNYHNGWCLNPVCSPTVVCLNAPNSQQLV